MERSSEDQKSEQQDRQRSELVDSLREVRAKARDAAAGEKPTSPAANPRKTNAVEPLPKHTPDRSDASAQQTPLVSPSRDDLNEAWNVAEAAPDARRGGGGLLAPIRRVLARLVRLGLGTTVDNQVRFNSSQVRFDNEIVQYLDARIDRLSQHYDSVLGAHGKRMEEIDERHLILQEELIRHVHDLVERIEYAFESAEQNHLYLEAVLREARDELRELRDRLDAVTAGSGGSDKR